MMALPDQPFNGAVPRLGWMIVFEGLWQVDRLCWVMFERFLFTNISFLSRVKQKSSFFLGTRSWINVERGPIAFFAARNGND